MNYSIRISETVLAIKPTFTIGHGDYISLVGFLRQTFKQDRCNEMISLKIIK